VPLVRTAPHFAPVTEVHPLVPEHGYALAKVMSETMAEQMQRWNPGTRFIGLRISNIFDADDYRAIPGYWSDPEIRKWNLWSWVDGRDVAQACRLGLESDLPTAETFTIAAADTLMNTPSRELMRLCFPDVTVQGSPGEFETLLSIDKARRLLGYAPQFTWR
jgi:nucleoside-diphosphate-sugar epimerase